MKRLLAVALLLTAGLAMGAGTAWAQENEKSGYAGVDLFSNYVWRGQKLSEEWAVQPYAGFMYKSFGAELWANYDTETEEHNETDLTLYYELTWKQFDIEAGYIYYGVDGASNDTQEIYGAFTFTEFFLQPTITAYLDFDEGDGIYLEGSVGYTHELPRDMILDLEALVSFNAENETTGSFTNFNTGELLAELAVPIYQDFTLTTTLGYTFPLTDSAEDRIRSRSFDGDAGHLYAGLGISLEF
jgi:hypothetical protein